MRLIRYLAQAEVASRRKCEEIVKNGLVKVNERLVTNPFLVVNETDSISVRGKPVAFTGDETVILLNKPAGIITTVKDPGKRKTVLDLVKTEKRLFPVGRLDKDTTGVLLLTNNGELAYRLTHPKFQIEKIYEVITDRLLTPSAVDRIRSGVDIGEDETGSGVVLSQEFTAHPGKKSKVAMITLQLTHGKKREIRRIFKSLKYQVLLLHRKSVAHIKTGRLKHGQWRKLTEKEIVKLKKSVGL